MLDTANHRTRLWLCVGALAAGLTVSGASAFQADHPPTGNEAAAKARRALERAQQAAGGRARLLAVRDITRVADLTQASSGVKATQTLRIVLPDAIHLVNEAGPATITAFVDPTRSWATSPWGVESPLPDWQARAARLDLLRELECLLVADADRKNTLDWIEQREFGGQRAEAIRIASPGAGEVTLFVDLATGDPLGVAYERPVDRGKGSLVIDHFSDFRKAGALRVPFKITTTNDGLPYMVSDITKIAYNSGLRVDDLARMPATPSPATPQR
jgi:hypothetical protein